ncbi:hypothetical protein [Paenibacillus thalictri]|uniref:Uncharacterized protein n=1 Tax=Paenibacillus thalictri TaxID=2527873 RepID=A0A4Q9DK46_9BACL|nr:hypothetical protein [Paenibacillus thalictri]TBL71468.1 hypothetical protein EYB31_30615 [Paenibacillus thalictri]
MNDLELASNYAPYIYFDSKEPFFPVKVGVTVFNKAGRSGSFPRAFEFEDPRVKHVIEYAIYWDYDIQHLYEMEHVWVYVGHQGEVVDAEASFHGKYLKSLLKDRSNIEDETHVKLYSQPGKHAFSPLTELFELLPDLRLATNERAGNAGLIITDIYKGVYSTSEEINRMVEQYLQTFRFIPSMEFVKYTIPADLYVPWDELYKQVPQRIEDRLAEIKSIEMH